MLSKVSTVAQVRERVIPSMPICTNPKCGEISKSKTRFCPHCGQESLSTVSKQELGNIQDEPLTTETFENETLYSPAPQDRVSNRKRIFHSTPDGVKFRIKLNVKKILAIMILVPIGAYLIFDAAPASLKDFISLKLDRQQEFSTDFKEDELQFKFMAYSKNGIPVYFKGCGPIDYFIRQNYASSADIAIVQTALSNLADAAGRSFNFKGLSENTEGKAFPGSVLIDFTNERESKELRKAQSDSEIGVAGLGGPGILGFADTPRFNSQVATDGTISINQRYWPGLNTEEKIAVIMHEMGHVLGLDHPVNGTNQLMDASGRYYSTSLGTGDLLGLQILSALGGCREFPDYLKVGSSQNSASEVTQSQSTQSVDSSAGSDTGLENMYLNRSTINSALNSCGSSYPEVIQELNFVIPSSWNLLEDDGCGSGRSHTWSNPYNSAESVSLSSWGGVGWCQDVDPDDLDTIASQLVGEVDYISRVWRSSGRFIYLYSDNLTTGHIEIGSESQFCGDGSIILTVNDQADMDLSDAIVEVVFGTF